MNDIRGRCDQDGVMRGAIVGFGNAALYAHLPAWQRHDRFAIDAVVEPDKQRAEKALKLIPGVSVFSSVEEMFANSELDFIDICTPPCFHVDLVIDACKTGLHVFCEKPLAAALEGFWQIRRIADLSERVVFTVNNWKYAPLWVKVGELVDQGEIGTIRSVSLNVLRTAKSGGGATDWRRCYEVAAGGILIDHGWHNLYVILSLVKEAPLTVSARMEFPHQDGKCCEETVDLLIHFENAEARLHLTWNASDRRNYGVVKGDKGRILINDDHLILDGSNGKSFHFDFPEALSASSHHPEWMSPVIENFENEIRDVQSRGVNLLEAQWCTRLIQSAYRSNLESSRKIAVFDPSRETARLPYCV